MKVHTLIDTFVNILNRPGILGKLEEDDVPSFLRIGAPDEAGYYHWKIRQHDGSAWIDPLMETLPERFPPSYYSLVSRYAFAVIEMSSIRLFANTGQDSQRELSSRLVRDAHLSPFLLQHGFVQIGTDEMIAYDPVCFDTNRGRREYPLVHIDHESILCDSRIRIMKEIAPSFVTFVKNAMEAMRDIPHLPTPSWREQP
jgi:hypothetical protein